MSMRRMRFCVHWLATFLLSAFVIGLASVFMHAVLARFERMAEEGGQAVFEQMTRASLQHLAGLGSRARSVLAIQAGLAPAEHRDSGEGPNPRIFSR